ELAVRVDRGFRIARRERQGRHSAAVAGRLDAGGEIYRVEHVLDGAVLQGDDGITIAIGLHVSAHTRTGRSVGGQRGHEGDGLAIDVQRRTGTDQRAET